MCFLIHKNYSYFCTYRLDYIITSEGIVDLSRRWPEHSVHDLEQNNYHFFLIMIFYGYVQLFSICDLVKIEITYKFLKMK